MKDSGHANVTSPKFRGAWFNFRHESKPIRLRTISLRGNSLSPVTVRIRTNKHKLTIIRLQPEESVIIDELGLVLVADETLMFEVEGFERGEGSFYVDSIVFTDLSAGERAVATPELRFSQVEKQDEVNWRIKAIVDAVEEKRKWE